MLANVLAVLLGLGSFIFYMAAFVYPEVHRRSDFLWGGLGLLYAGVLWFSAEQMTGLVLLGQIVAVALLLGLGWQTLTVRRQKTPVYQQTPIVLTPEIVGGWAKSKLNELRIAPDETVRSVRLERRAVEGKVVGDRIDPRRRPAYDYEFVEDGVALEEVTQGELFTIAPVEEAAPLSDESAVESAEVTPELDYAAPPSAEAEVITEVTTETVPELSSESSDLETPASEAESPEESVEESTEIESKPELEETMIPTGDAILRGRGSANATNIKASEAVEDESDWIDDSEIDTSAATGDALEPDQATKRTPPDKPGLLAMPLVLAVWVKDVVVSLTKPKPSKPVIEIPRREPSVEPLEQAKANNRYNDEPTATEPTATEPTITEPTITEPIDDDWEESNWDD